jgi:branched-chain amino acid transport system substrate-binding protein
VVAVSLLTEKEENAMLRVIQRWVPFVIVVVILSACGASSGGGVRDTAAPTDAVPTAATEAPTASGAGAAEGEPYRLGAVLNITGGGSSLGVPERDTLLMLQEQVNSAGGIAGPDGMLHPLEITILDDESDETKTVLSTKRLIDEQVLAIIGSSSSGPSIAMAPLVTEANIPMVSLAASVQIVEPVEERYWVFKTAQNDRLVAATLAAELKQRDLNDVAFLSVNNAFGDSGRVEFAQVAQAQGLNLVFEDRYGAEDTDMSSQLTRVSAANATALVNWAVSPPSAVVTKNRFDLGMTMPLYHSHGVANQTFLELAGPSAEGVRFVGGKLLVAEELPADDPQKEVLLTYAQDYFERYNTPVNAFGGYAYDAFFITAEALSRSGADPAKLRDEIEQTQEFVGVSGVFNMSAQDHNGLDERAVLVVEIRDGGWRLPE